MGTKRIDKNIKMNINSPDKVPDNINRIFDKFIDENLQSEKSNVRNRIIKPRFSLPQRIATAVASVATTMVAGGVIYAAVTGNSVFKLFNVNKEQYEKDLVTVSEQVTDNDISIRLQEYAIDHNAIIINYVINSDKELDMREFEDNIVADTTANDDVVVNIAKQNCVIDEENNSYKISTFYAIEEFENTLDKFTLNIHINKIAGVEGNWDFSIDMDKSKKEENKTYSFNHTETRNAPRIAVKTDYTPISMSVDNISVSNFSSIVNITIFNGQEGVEKEKQIEPKYPSGIVAKEQNPREWNKAVPLTFEVKDNQGNVLYMENYKYYRGNIGHFDYKKLIFPNIEEGVTSLTINIYSDDTRKELLGTFDLDLSEQVNTSSDRYKLDTEKRYDKMGMTIKYSSEWRALYFADDPYTVTLDTHDEFGSLIDIQIEEVSSRVYDNPRYQYIYGDSKDINLILDDIKKTDRDSYDTCEILSEGEEKIGVFDGVQYTTKTSISGEYEESKFLIAVVNDKVYVISYRCKPETFNNYKDYFYQVVENITFD